MINTFNKHDADRSDHQRHEDGKLEQPLLLRRVHAISRPSLCDQAPPRCMILKTKDRLADARAIRLKFCTFHGADA